MVDHQGRLRELAMAETIRHPAGQSSGAGPVTVKLTDYGTTANVSAPPAAQTTDLTNKITGH